MSNPLSAVVDVLARVPAFETYAGRSLLVPPELAPLARFEHHQQADLLSIVRTADGRGLLNEVLSSARSLAGETQLGAEIDKLRVGLKDASVADVMDGSTQRCEWPNEEYVLTAEPGWRATLTWRRGSRVSIGGQETRIPARDLFGPWGLTGARCQMILDRMGAGGAPDKTIRYTLQLVPRWHATVAKIALSAAMLWSCVVLAVILPQSSSFDLRPIRYAAVLLAVAAVVIAFIMEWRPGRKSIAARVRSPWVGGLALAGTLALSLVGGRILRFVRNDGPPCKLENGQRWDRTTWSLVPSWKEGLACAWDGEVKPAGNAKPDICTHRKIVGENADVGDWDRELLRRALRVSVAVAVPANEHGDRLHVDRCGPVIERPRPLATVESRNEIDLRLPTANGPMPLIPCKPVKDVLADEDLEGQRLAVGDTNVVWSFPGTTPKYRVTTNDMPELTVAGDLPGSKLTLKPCKWPTRLKLWYGGGYWVLNDWSAPEALTVEICRVSEALLGNRRTMRVNVGDYWIKEPAKVKTDGLLIAYSTPTNELWLEDGTRVCVVRSAGQCTLKSPEGRLVTPGRGGTSYTTPGTCD